MDQRFKLLHAKIFYVINLLYFDKYILSCTFSVTLVMADVTSFNEKGQISA